MTFNGITHILETPTKKFIAVGSVPLALMTKREANISDIMAGRVGSDGFAYSQTVFETAEALITAAMNAGIQLCDNRQCSCDKYFRGGR